MNMVNFLDGLDGLAAGVCAISGVTFCVIALSLGRPDTAILAAIVLGACLGFLRHNFYPARIFMGDSGALLLGFTLGGARRPGPLEDRAAVATLLFPLLVLAVPIIDTSFVVAKRIKYGQPVYAADKTHLHHRFLNIGFSQRRAALTMWGWCAILAGAALATRFIHPHAHGDWQTGPTIARRADRRARARGLDLHGLPARDRQAREPAHPPPRGGGARGSRAPHRLARGSSSKRSG